MAVPRSDDCGPLVSLQVAALRAGVSVGLFCSATGLRIIIHFDTPSLNAMHERVEHMHWVTVAIDALLGCLAVYGKYSLTVLAT